MQALHQTKGHKPHESGAQVEQLCILPTLAYRLANHVFGGTSPWLLSTCVYHASTDSSVRDASARGDRSAGDSGRVPAVSYATPKCLLGRLRDQLKLAVRLLGRRHRILMEGRTPCVRAISSGMMGIVWCRNHSRSHELLSSVALPAEFTSCDKDSVLIL